MVLNWYMSILLQ